MKNVILTVGPPCSGKTTWFEKVALDLETNSKTNFMHINRDEVRHMLTGGGYVRGTYRFDKEKIVTEVCEQAVRGFLNSTKIETLFITDTFLNIGVFSHLVNYLNENNCQVFVKTFFDIKLDELVYRHSIRVSDGGVNIPYFILESMFNQIEPMKVSINNLKEEKKIYDYDTI